MFRKSMIHSLLIAAAVLFCCALAGCGAGEGDDGCDGNVDGDVACVIGVISSGNVYTASIELSECKWTDLTQSQKNNVAAQCLETVAFTRGSEEDIDTGSSYYEVVGIDKATKEELFSYNSKSNKTIFE